MDVQPLYFRNNPDLFFYFVYVLKVSYSKFIFYQNESKPNILLRKNFGLANPLFSPNQCHK